MSITANEIQNVRFGEARRGYNPDEVDEFLERVAADVDVLNRALAEAANRVKDAESRAQAAEDQLAQAALAAPMPVVAPAAASVATAAAAPAGAISEDTISKAFIAAQISADRLKEEARKEAEKLYREADAKAKDIIKSAYTEREQTLGEIDYLRGVSEKFRTEFLSLINHYSTDAQKRFAAFADLIPAEAEASANSGMETLFQNNDATAIAPTTPSAPAASAAVAPASAVSSSGVESARPAPASAAPTARTTAPAAGAQQLSSNTDPNATTLMPAVSYALDDDLEIEEID